MGLSWPLGVNTEDCVVWAGGAVTSGGKGERPPAVALLIGWGVVYSTGGSDDMVEVLLVLEVILAENA